MPDNVMGDRLDRLQEGDWLHTDPPLLTGPTPEEGWREVTTVVVAGDAVTVTFDDDTVFVGRPNQLVRIAR